MPNIDKIVKNVMHEVSEGKSALRDTMTAALHNQEILIAQNKSIICLLEKINATLVPQREASGDETTAEITYGEIEV